MSNMFQTWHSFCLLDTQVFIFQVLKPLANAFYLAMMVKRLGLASTVSLAMKIYDLLGTQSNSLLILPVHRNSVRDQNLVKWIEMKGSLPEKYDHLNLVEGGQDVEGRRLFCARVEFKGSITPGK